MSGERRVSVVEAVRLEAMADLRASIRDAIEVAILGPDADAMPDSFENATDAIMGLFFSTDGETRKPSPRRLRS